jgi:parallel beta-helix repeat protein
MPKYRYTRRKILYREKYLIFFSGGILLKRKWLAVGIILLFVGTRIIPATTQEIEKPMPVSRGNTLYVGGFGSGNYTKIQDAIDNASSGDTVFVYHDASPYHERLIINTSIHLIGEDAATTCINYTDYAIIISLRADNTTISGFTIITFGYEAIKIYGNHSLISSNIIKPHINGWSGNGITTYRTHDTTITNNTISQTFNGIQFLNSQDSTITNNVLINQQSSGIVLGGTTTGLIIYNTITSNVWGGGASSYTGISLTQDADNNTIENNTIVSLSKEVIIGIRLWQAHNNLISGNTMINCGVQWWKEDDINTFLDNTVNGKPFLCLTDIQNQDITNVGQILLFSCSRITIHDFAIHDTPLGIGLFDSADCTITNITFINNWYGIDLSSSPLVTIQFCIMDDNRYGLSSDSTCEGIRVSNCTIHNNTYNGLTICSRSTIDHNSFTENSNGLSLLGLHTQRSSVFNNTFTYNGWAISLEGCRRTTIEGNLIEDNTQGIVFDHGYAPSVIPITNRNIITRNIIKGNGCGLNLTYGLGNIITKNSFIDNECQAFFDTAFRTRWNGNYWNDTPNAIHIIHGIFSFYRTHPWTGAIIWEKHIPWINVDWT